VNAVKNGLKEYRQKLHDYERPIALMSSIYVNSQKDPKKRDKPNTYLDFSFYRPLQDGDAPSGYNGSAYMELIRRKQLPYWALFCYKSLSASAVEGYVPDNVALLAEDAILLHPKRTGSNYKGLLIALESASDQMRVFRTTEGSEIALRVPYIDTKVVAREGEFLTP